MNRLSAFSTMPEVKHGVISDRSGTLIEHSGSDEAEAVAAVMSYLAAEITQCGESLGFGAPEKINVTGNNLSCIVFIRNDQVWSIYLDPSASQSVFEKKIEELSKIKPKNPMGGLR